MLTNPQEGMMVAFAGSPTEVLGTVELVYANGFVDIKRTDGTGTGSYYVGNLVEPDLEAQKAHLTEQVKQNSKEMSSLMRKQSRLLGQLRDVESKLKEEGK